MIRGLEQTAAATSPEARRKFFFPDLDRRAGVCVVDGYGISLTVERGHLVVHDGVGGFRRERRYSRATHGLRRVVALGHSGQVSLDAVRWMQKAGIWFLHLDRDRAVRASSDAGLGDPRLRRAQALAITTDQGRRIVVELISAKLVGQAKLLREHFDAEEPAGAIDDLRPALKDAETLDEIRSLEATAAILYFQAWAGRQKAATLFARHDQDAIPQHWLKFEGRRSILGSASSNRRAERPTNAILNYLFALSEAECRRACLLLGLDPGLGLLHADAAGRDSLALDILEPIRPRIEEYVLDLLGRRIFKRSDFAEGPDGSCRITAPLTHLLTATITRWGEEVAPWAEFVSRTIGSEVAGKYTVTSPLTGSQRRAAQADVKLRRARSLASGAAQRSERRRQMPTPVARSETPSTCIECGAPVARSAHLRCPACWVAQPGQSPEVREVRGRAIARTRIELEAWKRTHAQPRPTPAEFAPIRQGLAQVKLREIMAACSISKSTASMIRSGQHLPAARHWEALSRLAQDRKPLHDG